MLGSILVVFCIGTLERGQCSRFSVVFSLVMQLTFKGKRILKIPGVTSLEMNAPKTVPGIANNPNFKPIEYSILFCLE